MIPTARLAGVLVVLMMTLGALICCAAPSRPEIVVDHPDTLVDSPVHIRIIGLPPGHQVTIAATTADALQRTWSSQAVFRTDTHGLVDLAHATPQSGTYPNADPMGLFWSMRVPGAPWARFQTPDRELVTLTVTDGNVPLSQRSIVRRDTVHGLRTIKLTVSTGGVYGVLHLPAGSATSKPAVLVFGGSEGGDYVDSVAQLFALHGYPALSLAYFKEPGLPQHLSNIPLEYFGKALSYLAQQPGVDPHRIVVMGASRGGEAAELLGVHYPQFVHGVIALTPANVSVCGILKHAAFGGPAWTWQGSPIPFTCQPNNPAPTDQPAAVIPVEQIAGPVLVSCGGQDVEWSSCSYARAIIARLDAHHVRYQHRLMNYPTAGHLSNYVDPYIPFPVDPQLPADAPARAQEWPQILRFIETVPPGNTTGH